MKDKEKKNKKHHESTIGKIIYGFLLFLPLLAIGVTCLVNTFNNEAKNEVKVNYRYESNDINSSSDVKIGNIYKLDTTTLNRNESKTYFYASYIEVLNFSNTITNFDATTYGNNYRFDFYYDHTYNNFAIRLFNNTTLVTNVIATGYQRFNYINFVVNEIVDNSIINNLQLVPQNEIQINSVEEKNLSNVFYYSVDKVTQSNLFNWTTNTSIYTTINQFTNTLGITNTFMPLLLTYWLIISIVYFLYDIVLMILVVLHRKIHELQDTI